MGCKIRGQDGILHIFGGTLREQTIGSRQRGFACNNAFKKTVRTDFEFHSHLLCKNCAPSWGRTGLYGRAEVRPRPRYHRGDNTTVSG